MPRCVCDRAHDAFGEERAVQHEDALCFGSLEDRAQPARDHDAADKERPIRVDDLRGLGQRAPREEPRDRDAHQAPEREALVRVRLAVPRQWRDRRHACARCCTVAPTSRKSCSARLSNPAARMDPRRIFAARVAGHRGRRINGHDIADREAAAAVREDRRSPAPEYGVREHRLDREMRRPAAPTHEQDALGIGRGRCRRRGRDRRSASHSGGSNGFGRPTRPAAWRPTPHISRITPLPSRMVPCPVEHPATQRGALRFVFVHAERPIPGGRRLGEFMLAM